jgi:hypothetical protein
VASPKQIAANRINAEKSTGPTTAEGKATAKRNRLTHGLRANELILPGEDPAEFERFVAAWVDGWKPTTMARLELVEEAAKATWRRKRCARVEATRIARRMRTALRKARRREEIQAASVPLLDSGDRAAALAALARRRAGVDRLIALREEIAEAARSPEAWDDDEAHHFTLIALEGYCPADAPAAPLRDASWRLYLRNAPEMRGDGDPEPLGDAAAAAVAAELRRLALGRIEALRRLRSGLPGEPTREAEAEAFEPRPEDAALLRYEAQLTRQFHKALADLVRLAKSGDDLVPAEPGGPRRRRPRRARRPNPIRRRKPILGKRLHPIRNPPRRAPRRSGMGRMFRRFRSRRRGGIAAAGRGRSRGAGSAPRRPPKAAEIHRCG